MNNNNVLFSTNYSINYDNWVQQTLTSEDGITLYLRGTDSIYVKRNDYYLLLTIYDEDDVLIFKNYIKTIQDYKKLKKKLRWK